MHKYFKLIINIIKRQYYGICNSIVHRDSRIFFSCVITHHLPKRVRLIHPVGVVIGRGVVFGKNITILQNVTIGIRCIGESDSPKFGDNIFIGAGAVIVGDIEIGDNVIIGANSVVSRSIPANHFVKQANSIIKKRVDE